MTWLTPGERYPFRSHRHMGEVLADEALLRRQARKHRAPLRQPATRAHHIRTPALAELENNDGPN